MNHATVGSTLIMPYSQHHWEPPADSLLTFDPAKADTLLDAAGFKDVNGDGFRETEDDEKLSLRFYATADSPENQTAGKLIVDWLKKVWIKLDFQVIDAGALIDAQYNDKGDAYAPDWHLFTWCWTQDVDPQLMLSIYTPAFIEGWNDRLWTDPEYTKLNAQQSQTIDETARKSDRRHDHVVRQHIAHHHRRGGGAGGRRGGDAAAEPRPQAGASPSAPSCRYFGLKPETTRRGARRAAVPDADAARMFAPRRRWENIRHARHAGVA